MQVSRHRNIPTPSRLLLCESPPDIDVNRASILKTLWQRPQPSSPKTELSAHARSTTGPSPITANLTQLTIWSTEDEPHMALAPRPNRSTEEIVTTALQSVFSPRRSSSPVRFVPRDRPKEQVQVNQTLMEDMDSFLTMASTIHNSDVDGRRDEELEHLKSSLERERILRYEAEIRCSRMASLSDRHRSFKERDSSAPEWLPRRSVFSSTAEVAEVEAQDRLLMWRLEQHHLEHVISKFLLLARSRP